MKIYLPFYVMEIEKASQAIMDYDVYLDRFYYLRKLIAWNLDANLNYCRWRLTRWSDGHTNFINIFRYNKWYKEQVCKTRRIFGKVLYDCDKCNPIKQLKTTKDYNKYYLEKYARKNHNQEHSQGHSTP